MSDNYGELSATGLKKKAVKGAGINVVTQFLNFIFHFIGVIILARLLTPKDFGLVAMVTAFSLLPMNFGLNGFSEYIQQRQTISSKEINSIFWVHFFIASFFALGFVVFGYFLVDFYSEPALSSISAAFASSFILVALFTTPRALLRREMKFASIAVVDLVTGILSVIFSILVALAGMSYWAVVTRQLMIPVLIAIATWFTLSWRPGRPQNLSAAIPGLKFAVKVYGNFSIDYFTKSFDRMLLGKFHGSAILGNYERAYHLSSMPAQQIIFPLTTVALSTLSRLRDDRERYFQYYTKAVSMVAFIGTLAAVVLMLSSRDLVPLLLGPGWTETGEILMAFSPGIAAMLVYATISWLHLSLGTPGRWLRWNILATIVTVVFFAAAAPFGALAMAASVSLVKFILVLPGLWYAGRPIEMNIAALLRSIMPYFLAGILASAIWLSLPLIWPYFNVLYDHLSLFSRVLMIVVIIPLLYIGIVVILQRSFSSIYELVDLVKIFLKR
ncbi:MAG: lipopolysaccharide biosynthesis protein [Syntrophaceae bacterium]|nr:lipopolysaccharide biosynthesis protein [Syntrophaceae bacterium]